MQLGLPFVSAAGASLVAAGGGHAPAATATTSARTSPAVLPPVDLYFIRHHRARRYLLRVDVDGRARVTIPRGGSRRQAEAFAHGHLEWIQRQRARLQRSPLDADEQMALRRRAAVELPPRLLRRAAGLGLHVSRVTIGNQRSRWGSCGRDGHISLNWRLLQMPDEVCDYVLVHELMHLRRLDHSPQFWAMVAEACPDYRVARDWLRRHGPALR